MTTNALGSLTPAALVLALMIVGPEWEGRAATLDQHQAALPTATVLVRNTAGNIQIKGWDKDEVAVGGSYDDGVEKVEVSGTKERVEIRVITVDRWFGHGGSADLAIQLPRGARVEIETVSADIEALDLQGRVGIEDVSGDIRISGRLREIDVRTVSGDVSVRNVGERAKVRTVSGEISVGDASGEIELETVSGEVKASGEAFSRVRAKAVSGDLEVSGDLKKDATVDLESHSGDVKLHLPKSTSATFEIATFSGSLESELGGLDTGTQDVHGERRHRHDHGPGQKTTFTLGGGGSHVAVTTFSGDVHLVAR